MPTQAPLLSATGAALAMSVIRNSSTHARQPAPPLLILLLLLTLLLLLIADCCFSSTTYEVGDTKCANVAVATTTTNKTALKYSADNDWPKATRASVTRRRCWLHLFHCV
jgi:hypothetical protein